MKGIFTFFAVVLAFQLMAQCMPDPIYQDSSIGIYPPPYDSVSMTGGIDQPACINSPYDFLFNFVVPDSIDYNGILTEMEYIRVDGVDNLPAGLAYSCNPPDCFFEPVDGLTCLDIKGTTTDSPGDYLLDIKGKIKIGLSPIELDLNLVISLLVGGPAIYSIKVLDETDPQCIAGFNNVVESSVQFDISPNPASYRTTVEIFSGIQGAFDLQIMDMLGQVVYDSDTELFVGNNRLELDLSSFENGTYSLVLSNERGFATTRFMVAK